MNAAAQMAPIAGVLFLLVVVVGSFRGIPIEPHDWNLLISVFGGTFLLASLAVGTSALFDWYAVDGTGLRYRAEGGIGGARLFVKKSAAATWREIVDARPSRWLPYRCLELRIERPDAEGAARLESLSLPLYVRDRDGLLRDLSAHAPAGHPLRRALDEGAS